jgi:predicted dehydrogenase
VSARPLRWGVLGTGGIASKFVEGLQSIRERCPVVAVGSRSGDSARAFAARVPGCRAHASYQALLDDPEVEVVYVALLNPQHAEWCIRAAEAGKHVLCEKPATMTATELEGVLAAVRRAGTFFMEGFLYRCHPRWAALRGLLAAGAIGEVRLLQATFSFDAGGKERLVSRAQGGGALMDVGCYPLSWLRWIAGAEPVATTCLARLNTDGVDLSVTAALRFPDGVLGTLQASCAAVRHVGATVFGARGRIEITEPWRSTPGQSAFIVHRDDGVETITTPDDGLDTYAREALTVMAHLAGREAPAMTWDDSLGQARCLDALRHQAGVWWDGER